MPAKKCLIGLTFGKLKVIAEAPMRRTSGGRPLLRYLCECECGTKKECRAAALRNGDNKSCGCTWGTQKANLSHGQASDKGRSKEYIAWDHMIQRCTNPNCKAWKWYGARGITVDPRWLDFANFFADMGPKPEGLTLERKDSNKGYNKENCTWDTTGVQARTRRNNRNFTINGVTGCMTDLARHFGIDFGTVQSRINRYGWSPVEAFTTPAAKRVWKNNPPHP